jgi:hypothetical protein
LAFGARLIWSSSQHSFIFQLGFGVVQQLSFTLIKWKLLQQGAWKRMLLQCDGEILQSHYNCLTFCGAAWHKELEKLFFLLCEKDIWMYSGFGFWVVFSLLLFVLHFLKVNFLLVVFVCGCKLVKLNNIKSSCSVWLSYFIIFSYALLGS